MPTDPKWREAQLQAMLALGDAPQDAERVLAAMERISPDDPRLLPDPEAFAAMFGQVTPDDVRDATADWMVRARPEWKRLLTATSKGTAQEFNPHHDALGRFAAGSAAVGLSYHALGRIGTQGRANVTSVRDALERLQTVKTPDSDWSYPLKQGDKLRGHLIGTDGIVKTVVGAWYKPDKLPPALSEADMTEGTIDVARSIAWHLERLTDAEAARFCEEAGLAPLTAGEFREQWTGSTWDDLAMLIYIRREDEPVGEFNPHHDALGRFATGPGMHAPDTGGGGGGTSIFASQKTDKWWDRITTKFDFADGQERPWAQELRAATSGEDVASILCRLETDLKDQEQAALDAKNKAFQSWLGASKRGATQAEVDRLQQEWQNAQQAATGLRKEYDGIEADVRRVLRVWDSNDVPVVDERAVKKGWFTSADVSRLTAAHQFITSFMTPEVAKSLRTNITYMDRNERAHCRDNVIALNKPKKSTFGTWGDAVETQAHEMGHVLENVVAGAKKRALAWRNGRIRGETPTRILGCGPDEVGYKDSFVSHYTGKVYASGHSEVTSEGFQRYVLSPLKFAMVDPEHFALVYNIAHGRA